MRGGEPYFLMREEGSLDELHAAVNFNDAKIRDCSI